VGVPAVLVGGTLDPSALRFRLPENTHEARRENPLRRDLFWERWASRSKRGTRHLFGLSGEIWSGLLRSAIFANGLVFRWEPGEKLWRGYRYHELPPYSLQGNPVPFYLAIPEWTFTKGFPPKVLAPGDPVAVQAAAVSPQEKRLLTALHDRVPWPREMKILHKLAKALRLPELPEALEAGDPDALEEARARALVLHLG